MKLYELFPTLKKGDWIKSTDWIKLFFDGRYLCTENKDTVAHLDQVFWLYTDWHVVKPGLNPFNLRPGDRIKKYGYTYTVIESELFGANRVNDHYRFVLRPDMPNLEITDLAGWEAAE